MLRRIKTQAELDRQRRRNHVLVGIVMIGLLVVSTLGYSLMSSEGDGSSMVNEGGVDFFKENGIWKIIVDDEVFGFQNLPSEVSDVDVNVSLDLSVYVGKPLYFVSPNEGASEVLNNIGRYVLRYQESCLRQGSGESDELGNLTEGDCEGDFPVKDCESNLIVFVEGNSTMVYQDGNCIFIVGDSVKGVDAFLYKVLGIGSFAS